MRPQLRQPPPDGSRKALVALAIATAGGVAALSAVQIYGPDLGAWLHRQGADADPDLALAALGTLIVAPIFGFVIWMWRLGARCFASERFPPPGTAVTADTPVLRGAAARRRGRVIQALAVAVGVTACALVLILWRMAA
jgi:hypothetical protein